MPSSPDDLTIADVRMWTVHKVNVVQGSREKIKGFVRGFGEDGYELYIMASQEVGPTGNPGKVYRIVPSDKTAASSPAQN